MKTALMVVDMQNGFLNSSTEHIVEHVKTLLREAEKRGVPTLFTRFVNHPDSSWVKWIRWSRFMQSPEIDLIPALAGKTINVFDKSTYTAFIPAVSDFVRTNAIERLTICGIATDGCVLKTAVDAFERGIQPIIVSDACASHAGAEVHAAGLMLAARFIGKRQIISLKDLTAFGFEAPSFTESH